MKIALIFFSLNVPGGSASVFLSLASELQAQGHSVEVFSYYFDEENCFPELNKNLRIHAVKKIGLQNHRINNNSLFNRFALGFDYYLNARKIYSLMKDYSFDVILASEACAYIPALLYKKKNNIPVFWSVFDPLSLVDNKRPGLITQKYKWFTFILRLHNLIDSRLIRKLDKVIVPTKKMKSQLDSFYKINSLVLPLAGVRYKEFTKDNTLKAEHRLKSKFNFVKKNEIILFSNGHLLPHRRYEDVIYALNKLLKDKYSLKYIISGSDKFDPLYYDDLQRLSKKLKLEKHIIFDTEFKTNDEILAYYQYCDIFLFVSTEQTWGLAPFEAMLSKKPVVISDGVGCSEVLKNRKDALIVPEKSPDEIASSIKLILADKKVSQTLSESGYHSALNNFTYESIAQKLISYFNLERKYYPNTELDNT